METIIATIFTGIITLIGIFVSAKSTRDKVTNELEKQNALQNAEIQRIKDDIRELKADVKNHNHYAQLFQETASVLQEKISVANHRISDLESR